MDCQISSWGNEIPSTDHREWRSYQQVSAQSKNWSSVQTELHTQAIWEGMPEKGLVTTMKSPLKRDSNWKSQVLFTKKNLSLCPQPWSTGPGEPWWGRDMRDRQLLHLFLLLWYERRETLVTRTVQHLLCSVSQWTFRTLSTLFLKRTRQ